MSKLDDKALELRMELENDLGEIEMGVLTSYKLSDAIREGSLVSTQEFGWGTGDTACALTAAIIGAKSRGYQVG